MTNKYIHEQLNKFARGVKSILLAGVLVLVASCGSNTVDLDDNKLTTGVAPAMKSANFGTPASAAEVASMTQVISGYFNGQHATDTKALIGEHAKTKFLPAFTPMIAASNEAKPVFRFYNTKTGAHFFTMSAQERDYVINTFPFFSFEGNSFFAYPDADSTLKPVYRFYNQVNGTHFFTISPEERDYVIATWPTIFNYEGISWHASPTPRTGWVPVYRFFNTITGTHFYTTSAAERDHVLATWSQFLFEGIAYYVMQTAPPPTDNKIVAEVKAGLVVLPIAATNSASNTVVPLVAGGAQIDSTDAQVAALTPNQMVHIAPSEGGFSLPFTGRVVSNTTVNGKQQVRLVPVNAEDVYENISWDIDTARGDTTISGVMAPLNARVSFSQASVKQSSGGIDPMFTTTGKFIKDPQTNSKLTGTVEIAHDFYDKTGKKITLAAKVDIADVTIRSKADYNPIKYLFGGGWAQLSSVIKGEIGGSVSLNGSTDTDASLAQLFTNTDMWDQLKWKNGSSFTLEGLDAKDKRGRIPIGGIILVPSATGSFAGNLSPAALSAISMPPAAVLWIYVDISGKITAEGEIGWRSSGNKFERGYELAASGLDLKATQINNYSRGSQELYAKGNVKVNQRVGFTITGDVFVGGIRPLSVNAFTGGEFDASFEGEGVRAIAPTTDLTGNVCAKAKVWAGAELSLAARVKAKVKLNLYFIRPVIEDVVQSEITEKVLTLLDQDLGSVCVTSGLFSISASAGRADPAAYGYALVNVDFTPAFNNASIASKTDHWWVKASCSGCVDKFFEIPKSQAGIGVISLPTGRSYTLTLEAKSDDYGVIKSATTSLNITAGPIATIAVTPNNNSCSNIKLAAAASATPGATITSYVWTVQRAGGVEQTYTGNPVSSVPLSSCGSTIISLRLIDSLGYISVYSQTINTNNLSALISSVTPTTATLNTATVFTVTGTNLPLTATLAVQDAICQSPVSNTATGFTQTCTPGGAVGAKTITIKTATGGTVIDATRTVNATATPVTTGLLTDTGITASQCYGAGSNTLISCTSAAAIALNDKQDGMIGRDVATPNAADGKLGFSYSTVGSYPITDCVKDNITGRMWEGKPTTGVRANTLTFTNTGNNAANDASGYITAVNSGAGLCGFTDWRLPTRDEMQSLVDYGVAISSPAIDTTWFPNTVGNWYWTASPVAGGTFYAWHVNFFNGVVSSNDNYSSYYVRLVR
jgi:hypothetical protein